MVPMNFNKKSTNKELSAIRNIFKSRQISPANRILENLEDDLWNLLHNIKLKKKIPMNNRLQFLRNKFNQFKRADGIIV